MTYYSGISILDIQNAHSISAGVLDQKHGLPANASVAADHDFGAREKGRGAKGPAARA
jgi:hypothetical protein